MCILESTARERIGSFSVNSEIYLISEDCPSTAPQDSRLLTVLPGSWNQYEFFKSDAHTETQASKENCSWRITLGQISLRGRTVNGKRVKQRRKRWGCRERKRSLPPPGRQLGEPRRVQCGSGCGWRVRGILQTLTKKKKIRF